MQDSEQLNVEINVVEHKDEIISDRNNQLTFPFIKQPQEKEDKFKMGSIPGVADKLMQLKKGLKEDK